MKKAKTTRQPSNGAEATIRMLRQQLKNAMASNHALQLDRSDKEKVIAGYDVQLSEVQDELRRLQARCAEQAASIGHHRSALRATEKRLAYLGGYYAKSQEAIAPRAETQPRADFGDSSRATLAAARGEGSRFEGSTEGLARTAGDALRVQQTAPQAYPRRYPVPKRDFPAFAARSQTEASVDPGPAFGLTAEELAVLDAMKESDAHHADDGRTIKPRTPYRGIDGPLL